jgi:hypothetical protein
MYLGKSAELMQLMEQGLGLDNAHSGIFSDLAVLYSKYSPEKLMEHIKVFWSRMNVVKVLRACEKALLWNETVFLYKEDGQHDSAIRTMTDHSVAFKQDLFFECVQKVRNPEVQYKAISFYVLQHPLHLGHLLAVLTPHLDHARVVHLLRKNHALPLALDYMRNVQKENLSVVNEALNEMAVLEEDFEGLRTSIDDYDNFDQIQLAQKVRFTILYKKNSGTFFFITILYFILLTIQFLLCLRWRSMSCWSSDVWQLTFTRRIRDGLNRCSSVRRIVCTKMLLILLVKVRMERYLRSC